MPRCSARSNKGVPPLCFVPLHLSGGEKCGDLRWWVATLIRRRSLWRLLNVRVFPCCALNIELPRNSFIPGICLTGPPCGKCVRFGATRSGVRLSAGSYQDLVNWYCNLLTWSTKCAIQIAKQNQVKWYRTLLQTQSWRYTTVLQLQSAIKNTK